MRTVNLKRCDASELSTHAHAGNRQEISKLGNPGCVVANANGTVMCGSSRRPALKKSTGPSGKSVARIGVANIQGWTGDRFGLSHEWVRRMSELALVKVRRSFDKAAKIPSQEHEKRRSRVMERIARLGSKAVARCQLVRA